MRGLLFAWALDTVASPAWADCNIPGLDSRLEDRLEQFAAMMKTFTAILAERHEGRKADDDAVHFLACIAEATTAWRQQFANSKAPEGDKTIVYDALELAEWTDSSCRCWNRAISSLKSVLPALA